jgi:hypothetical protein
MTMCFYDPMVITRFIRPMKATGNLSLMAGDASSYHQFRGWSPTKSSLFSTQNAIQLSKNRVFRYHHNQ